MERKFFTIASKNSYNEETVLVECGHSFNLVSKSSFQEHISFSLKKFKTEKEALNYIKGRPNLLKDKNIKISPVTETVI